MSRHGARDAEDPVLIGVEIKQGILAVPETSGFGACLDPAWMGKPEEVRLGKASPFHAGRGLPAGTGRKPRTVRGSPSRRAWRGKAVR